MKELIYGGERYYLRAKMNDTLIYENASGTDALVIVNTVLSCKIRAVSTGNVGFIKIDMPMFASDNKI